MKRKPIVGISMKIYQNKIDDAVNYAKSVSNLERDEKQVDLFLLPSLGTIYPVSKALLENNSIIKFGAQNIAPIKNGAMTGEFSLESLIDMGGSYVELGHYERRTFLQENDEVINTKVQLAVQNNLIPILCIGEPQKEDSQNLEKTFTNMLNSDLANIDPQKLNNMLIAYEPYWAIGKEEAANADYVANVHHIIRKVLQNTLGNVSQNIRIIYGGSVSKNSAKEIANSEDVDGVFVGRFGHDPNNFKKIIEEVKKAQY